MSSSPFETVDCVVIGAGVVGLAVARALALAGREVIVLESAEGIGTETSSRNSEVIHAGIYYPNGSLMAETCAQLLGRPISLDLHDHPNTVIIHALISLASTHDHTSVAV